MTKEEIEEGRRLLAQYREAGVHPERFMMAVDWYFDHADELLSLAEEARWRKSEEEAPPPDAWIFMLLEPEGFILRPPGIDPTPGLWRPAPYCAMAFEMGLRRGLELAKEHISFDDSTHVTGRRGEGRPNWTEADRAVEEECK